MPIFFFLDALYKWLTKNSGGNGFGVSGGFGGNPSFYDTSYTFNEPDFVGNIDAGSRYVPAAAGTPADAAWKKRK